jgi:hypothetical protein
MRKIFALILCALCFNGCAAFRHRATDIGTHVADGPGDAMYHGTATAARYAPTVAVFAAFEVAWHWVFGDDDNSFDE